MNCPSCSSENTTKMKATTALGYQQYRCRKCSKQSNERSGTTLNKISFQQRRS